MSWCWCSRGSVGVRGYLTISVSSRSRDGGPPGALASRGRPSEGRSNTRADQRRVERPGPPTPGGRRRSTRRTRERTSRCIRGGSAGQYPARSGGPAPRWRRFLGWLVPPTSSRTRRRDGLLTAPGPDLTAFAVAVLIAALAAFLFEHFARMSPVPPGGDDGTWLLNAFPYVGLPSTNQAPILSYPPASFPFLGLAVRITGSPLT